MNATEAYKCDLDFRNLVDEWVSSYQCPLPLVDRCLELCMYEQAEVARWASVNNKDIYFDYPNVGVYPAYLKYDSGEYMWRDLNSSREFLNYSHSVRLNKAYGVTKFPTALEAILFLLDNMEAP